MLIKVFIILSLLFCPLALSEESKPFNIILFSPQHNDEGYWGNLHDFARASANDLGINFSVVYNTDGNTKKLGSRYDYIESLENVLKSKNKPDAFMAVMFKSKAEELLALSEKYDVPMLILNSQLSTKQKTLIGTPRSKYKYYIGYIRPDSEQMSYLLSTHLLNQVKNDSNNPIELAAISGTRAGQSHPPRISGLKRAIKDKNNAQLNQVVFGNWRQENAYQLTHKLMHRYDDLQVFWCSSDLMALGVQRAINESGKHIIAGGFDWTSDAIHSIKSGELSASVGGHFTNGAFGLVLLYDFLHGNDFSDVISTNILTKGALIHKGNVDKYSNFLIKQGWGAVNFKKYSRTYHPENESYNFSFDYLLENRH